MEGDYVEVLDTRVRSFAVSTLISRNLAGTPMPGHVKEAGGTCLELADSMLCRKDRPATTIAAPLFSIDLLPSFLILSLCNAFYCA